MKYIGFVIVILFCLTTEESIGQSKAKADSFFYAANNRLKAKWDFIDTSVFHKAIDDYSEVLRYSPEYWQAYRNRARIYSHLKNYEFALIDLTHALQYADRHSHAKLFEMKGQVLYDMGHYKDAIDDLDAALKDPQDKPKTLLLLAKAKWKMGHKREACKDYNEAILLNKNLVSQKEFIECEPPKEK